VRVTHSPTNALTPTAVALGNFDGLHLGHRQVICPVIQSGTETLPELVADAYLLSNSFVSGAGENLHGAEVFTRSNGTEHRQTYATVVTFHPHPREFFSRQCRTALTPLSEKVMHLEALGVEQLVLLPFNQELANLSPQEFVETILIRQLQAKRISVGQNFCFGRKRAGTTSDLKTIATKHGVEVVIVPMQTHYGERISSSAIRQALQDGKVEVANSLLGRPYSLVGQVVQGQQLGRTIGFPTANLQLPPEKFLPRLGVYGVRVDISDSIAAMTSSAAQDIEFVQDGDLTIDDSHTLKSLPAVMNLGYRPTVSGTQLTVEVHLLEWEGNLYGRTLAVNLEKFLRPEQKFASLEALKAQIQCDCVAAKAALAIA
jgi:riboflavin kinase / FMN adenylyltransferase